MLEHLTKETKKADISLKPRKIISELWEARKYGSAQSLENLASTNYYLYTDLPSDDPQGHYHRAISRILRGETLKADEKDSLLPLDLEDSKEISRLHRIHAEDIFQESGDYDALLLSLKVASIFDPSDFGLKYELSYHMLRLGFTEDSRRLLFGTLEQEPLLRSSDKKFSLVHVYQDFYCEHEYNQALCILYEMSQKVQANFDPDSAGFISELFDAEFDRVNLKKSNLARAKPYSNVIAQEARVDIVDESGNVSGSFAMSVVRIDYFPEENSAQVFVVCTDPTSSKDIVTYRANVLDTNSAISQYGKTVCRIVQEFIPELISPENMITGMSVSYSGQDLKDLFQKIRPAMPTVN